MVVHPVYQLPPIAPIDPEQPQLVTSPAEPGEEETGASRVRDGGRRDDHGHQESQRIHYPMVLAPCDVFACVIAAFASECCGLDALAVDAARRWVLVTPCLLGAPGVVETWPVAAVTPWAKVTIHPSGLSIFD